MTRTLLRTLASAALLAASTAAFSQTPAPQPGAGGATDGKPRGSRYDCSKAADPQACEARRAKLRAVAQKARAACEGKPADERRACMTKEMCAQSADPAKCEARAKQRAEKRRARGESRVPQQQAPKQ